MIYLYYDKPIFTDMVIGLSKLFDQHGIENWIIDDALVRGPKWVQSIVQQEKQASKQDKTKGRGPLAGLLESDTLFICFYNTGFPKRMIFYNSEPLRFRKEEDFKGLGQCEEVWDYSLDNREFVDSFNPGNFRYLPFGYLSYYEECYQRRLQTPSQISLEVSAEIDILYYGIMNERRQNLLQTLGGSFRVFCATPNVKRSEEFISNVDRDQLISRSKIVLSINKKEDSAPTNDLFRLGYLISNRIFVICEKNSDPMTSELEKMGILHGQADQLPEMCGYYLGRPKERQERAEKAYQLFKEKYSYEKWLPWEMLKKE